MYEVEHFFSSQNQLGEGPVWDEQTGQLYWLDIEQKFIYRLNLKDKNNQPERFAMPEMVGALTLRAEGGLLLATKKGFATWNEHDREPNIIASPESDKPNNRFNDGKADTQGRFWAGTMSLTPTAENPQGSFYRFDPDGAVSLMETNLTISNGLGWSPDNRQMYLTDTLKNIIYVYDFDADSGTISNRRIFCQDTDQPGKPDGLTVDSEGYVWNARYGGWRINRYAPNGQLDRVIELPVEAVTCPTFGGANLDELYITTAWNGLSAEQRKAQPYAGDIFRVKVPVKGLPTNRSSYANYII